MVDRALFSVFPLVPCVQDGDDRLVPMPTCPAVAFLVALSVVLGVTMAEAAWPGGSLTLEDGSLFHARVI